MDIPELEQQLVETQEHLRELQGVRGRPIFEELRDAFDRLAKAQRALASARSEEYAVPYDIGFTPEAAVSGPVLLQTDYRTILTFNAVRRMPDGLRHRIGHGIVEIESCSVTKFGYPNDEALPGHPLYSKGLQAYGVYEVRNSLWIRQITEQNRIPFPETPDSTQKHFLFIFHDGSLECIASSLRAFVSTEPYSRVFQEMTQRVFGREEAVADERDDRHVRN